MHHFDDDSGELARAIFEYALARVRMDPPPLDGPKSPSALQAEVGETITVDGLGGMNALNVFVERLAPASISVDHPRFFVVRSGRPHRSLRALRPGRRAPVRCSAARGSRARVRSMPRIRRCVGSPIWPVCRPGPGSIRVGRHRGEPQRPRGRPLCVARAEPRASEDASGDCRWPDRRTRRSCRRRV